MIRSIFRTLRYRDFRLFFVGQGVSMVGTQLQVAAMSWLVYRLSGSAAELGLVNFVSRGPTFFFAPLGGMLVDRTDRRRAFFVVQSLFMAQATLLAVLVLGGWIQLWHLFALGFLLGVVNGFEVPIRQALVHDLVEDKGELGSALALNTTIINATTLGGSLAAAGIIKVLGEGTCFVLNALSFVAVLGCLLAMGRTLQATPRARPVAGSGFREGLNHTFGSLSVRNLLLLLFLVSLLGLPYGVLLPVFAKEVLRGGVGVFGELGAASGAGALAGTLYMASRSSLKGLGGRLALAVLVFGLCLAAFSRTHSVALALCLQIPVGLGSGLLITGVQTLVQSLVRDDVRGRVMSFYTMSFMGTMPFGGLMFGYAAQRFGAPATILVGGLACTVAGAYFWIRLPHFHSHAGPILSAKGFL